MKLLTLLPLLLHCALSDRTCAATPQQPLEIAGIDEPTSLVESWVSVIEEPLAAIRHDQAAKEVTLLFVHTTVDMSYSGPDCAAGVIRTYPFLIHPEPEWVASAAVPPAFTGEVINSTMPLGVPPWRISAHLQQFLADADGQTSAYGEHNNTALLLEDRRVGPFPYPAELLIRDERHAWKEAGWTPATGPIGGQVLNVNGLGRDAVMQAAYCYAHQNPLLPPLDPHALTGLNNFLDSQFGFEIHVQAVHVTLSPEPIKLRFDQRGVMKRRSLFEFIQDEWWMLKGPQRWVPSLLNASINVYLGGLNDEMHILFPTPVSGLRALVPTSSGLVDLPQIPVFDSFGDPLRPEIGVFHCPVDALPGTVYFYQPTPPGTPIVPVIPVNPFDFGALLSPFVMPGHP